MNGEYKRTFQAVVKRGVTVFDLRQGKTLRIEPGDELTLVEDSYGNTYVDGEVFVGSQYWDEEA